MAAGENSRSDGHVAQVADAILGSERWREAEQPHMTMSELARAGNPSGLLPLSILNEQLGPFPTGSNIHRGRA